MMVEVEAISSSCGFSQSEIARLVLGDGCKYKRTNSWTRRYIEGSQVDTQLSKRKAGGDTEREVVVGGGQGGEEEEGVGGRHLMGGDLGGGASDTG